MTGNRQGNPYSTFDGEDGSVLQGDNELIDNTRDHRTDRLWKHNPLHSPPVGKAQRTRGFHLPDIHGLNALWMWYMRCTKVYPA